MFLKISSIVSRLNPIPGPAELGRHWVQLAPPSRFLIAASIAKAALLIARAATAEIGCFR
jgi:hypothetical protein